MPFWCARRAGAFIAISTSYQGLSNHKVHFEPNKGLSGGAAMTSPTKAAANRVGDNIHNDRFALPEAVVPEKSAFDAVDGAHPAALRCHRVVALEQPH